LSAFRFSPVSIIALQFQDKLAKSLTFKQQCCVRNLEASDRKVLPSVLKSARSFRLAMSNNSVGSSADGDLLLPDARHIRRNSSNSMHE